MTRERNPREYFQARILQLNNQTPVFGKMVRKKVITEICFSSFSGFYAEKIAAIAAGLNHKDSDIRKIAEEYLLGLEDETDTESIHRNKAHKELINELCEYYVETKDIRILKIIRQKNYISEFDCIFKKIIFEYGVYGFEQAKTLIDQLSLAELFKLLQLTDIDEITRYINNHLRNTLTETNLNEMFDLFLQDNHSCYCEYLNKFFSQLSFKQKLNYIDYLPRTKHYEGNKEALVNTLIRQTHEDIKKDPSIVDARYALQKLKETPFNEWILDLLVKNRPLLSIENDLALCNHFKEYDKVRDYIKDFSLEDLCKNYPYSINTPIECMFAQKLRMTIRKQNYQFNFFLIQNFFNMIEENLKVEVFKLLSNFSTPVFYDFVLYQMDKITSYSKEEQRIYLEEIIPFYIPMFARLPGEKQLDTINKLPDLNFATLDFYINSILNMVSKKNMITYLEKLITSNKFTEHQKLVITEIIIHQKPELIELSNVLNGEYIIKYEKQIENLKTLITDLEKECLKNYIRDDRSGHNESIDKQRDYLCNEIIKRDFETTIEMLLPYYNEDNYRMKRDIKKILSKTSIGYRILIPFALTSGMEDKDRRNFAVVVLEKRIQPYIPFHPTINIKREHLRYVDFFASEEEVVFRNLSNHMKQCKLVPQK